jgi:hypothetical protein
MRTIEEQKERLERQRQEILSAASGLNFRWDFDIERAFDLCHDVKGAAQLMERILEEIKRA